MAEKRFGGTVIKLNGTVVARVSSIRRQNQMTEVDATGAENVSGALTLKQLIPVAIDETVELSGTAMAGSGVRLEPGQSALNAAAVAGTLVTLKVLDAESFGHDYVGYFTSYNEEGSASDLWRFNGTFRANSRTAVTS